MTDATLPKLPQATAWITVIETSQGPSSQVNWTQMRGVKHHPLFSADQLSAFAERVRQDERERAEQDAKRYRWLRDHGAARRITASSASQMDGSGPYITMTMPGTRPMLVDLQDPAWTDAAIDAAMAQQVPINQCDGCRQGAPLRGNLHIDKDGHAFMGCSRDRYLPDPGLPA